MESKQHQNPNTHFSMEVDFKSPVFQGVIRGMLPWMLLNVLKEGPTHALNMINALSQRTHGFWKPSPGSVYPILHRFEEEGIVDSEWQESKAAPRRVYRLTDKGMPEVPAMRRKLIEELTKARHIIDIHIKVLEQGAKSEHGSHDI